MEENKKYLSKEQAIIEFLNLPQDYDYMIISPIHTRRQLKSKYLRGKIFELKGTVCGSCGSKKSITIHHKTYELVMPKGLRKASLRSQGYTNRTQRCEEHNRNISKKYFLWANEDQKWELIQQNFPDFFKQTIKNMEVLCWKCHKKKHIKYKKETGSFMPLHSYHKDQMIEIE